MSANDRYARELAGKLAEMPLPVVQPATRYAVTVTATQGLWLLDSAAVWGVEMFAEPVSDGTRLIEFGARTHAYLSALPEDNDGLISSGQMWIGGTEYAVTTR